MACSVSTLVSLAFLAPWWLFTIPHLKADKCVYEPACKCGVIQSEVDLATVDCENQTNFPKFPTNPTGFTYMTINGDFETIPSNAFANLQLGEIYWVTIRGAKQPQLLIKAHAFNNSFRNLNIRNITNLTLAPDALLGAIVEQLELEDIDSIECNTSSFNGLKVKYITIKNSKIEKLKSNLFDGVAMLEAAYAYTDTLLHVTLTNVGLHTVPDFGKSAVHVKSLDLSKNLIKHLQKSVLHRFPNLTELVLSDNPIDGDKLNELLAVKDSLTKFVCTNCKLSEFPKELGALTKLKEIDLSGNHIARIPSDVFTLLTSLNSLILSDNPIGRSNLKSFAGIRNSIFFEAFKCSNCSLIEIPAEISNHPNLTLLELNLNNITKIRYGDFLTTSSGTKGYYGVAIHLNENPIEKIDPGALTTLRWTHLGLANTSLTEFNMAWIPNKIHKCNYHTLDLSGNKYLTRLYTSNTTTNKLRAFCASIDVSESGVHQIDPNVFLNLDSFDTLSLANTKHFDCSNELRWMALCILCESEQAHISCNYRRVEVRGATCKDMKMTLRNHLRNKYLSTFQNCSNREESKE